MRLTPRRPRGYPALTMRSKALVAFLALFLCGCLISEQEGEGTEELTFHFDSTFNKAVVYGRSAALGLLAFWFFAAERGTSKKVASIALGLPALGLAGWFLFRDLPTLQHYRVEVRDGGLYLRIPPEPEKEVQWGSIETMVIKGIEYQRGTVNPVTRQKDMWTDLPDWHTLELRLVGEDPYAVDLERLSVEQRQTLWKAIATRARMVEQK